MAGSHLLPSREVSREVPDVALDNSADRMKTGIPRLLTSDELEGTRPREVGMGFCRRVEAENFGRIQFMKDLLL